MSAMLVGSVAAWLLVSHLIEADASKRRSKAALEQILSAASGLPIDSARRLVESRRDSMSPDDALLARLHLAKMIGDDNDIFRLIDSARLSDLAPPESLDAWRMLPYETALSRRMATLDPNREDLDSIARIADSCLARDSTLLACHVVGTLTSALDRNWREFRRRTDRAIQLRPGDFRIQGFRGIGFLVQGELVAAKAWLPDARFRGSDSLPYGRLFRWSSRMFQPWRAAADSAATDNFCKRAGIPDSIREKIAVIQAVESAPASPTGGFVSCTVAPDTHGAIHVCRPQEAIAAFPQLGSDTAPAPRSDSPR